MARANGTPSTRWAARRDGLGSWQVVREDDTEPLRATDPLDRLTNVFLAAAAPDLAAALNEAVHRLETLIGATGMANLDRKLIARCHGALVCSRPPIEHILGALDQRRAAQGELDLTVAAVEVSAQSVA